jgi:hypothetical protein
MMMKTCDHCGIELDQRYLGHVCPNAEPAEPFGVEFEDDCSIVGVEAGDGNGERFDFRLPRDLVCIMDAECYPVCFVQPDRAEAVVALLNEALGARARRE